MNLLIPEDEMEQIIDHLYSEKVYPYRLFWQ